MKILMVLAMGVLVVSATTAKAMDSDAILGGAFGGGAGAAIGSAVGGHDGAIIGGAVGGAAGVAVATSDRRRKNIRVRKEIVYLHDDGHHDNGRHLGHYKNKYKHHRHDHDA
jgi:outer membrane lipoprotein SlyB